MPHLFAVLLAAYLSGQAADTGSTLAAMRHGGVEGNPVVGWTDGPGPVIVVKSGVTAGTAAIFLHLRRNHPTLALTALSVSTGCIWAAAAHNLSRGR